MKKSIACIICNKGKVLIAHRNPTGQMGSRWEFPGGKVDDGETEQEAIRREMREEFDVDVGGLDLLLGDVIDDLLQPEHVFRTVAVHKLLQR